MRSGEKLNNNEQEFVNNLDSALRKMPNYEGIVYHSLSSDIIEDIDGFWRECSNNSVVKYDSFTSTSTSIYDDSMDIQMVIKSKYGKDIRQYNPNESEILFNKDTLFYISEVKSNMIFMEEI